VPGRGCFVAFCRALAKSSASLPRSSHYEEDRLNPPFREVATFILFSPFPSNFQAMVSGFSILYCVAILEAIVTVAYSQERCRSNTLKVSALVNHRPKALTIAHRGASSHLPEHTLPAYRLALELGADYIQPDLLATQDGKLVAIHTADLATTTNVEDVFPDRLWYSPWVKEEGYWVFNFTLNEIKQLRVTQNLEDARAIMYDMLFQVPTLEEILRILNKWNMDDLPAIIGYNGTINNRGGNSPTQLELAQAGLYMELKDVAWLNDEAGIDMVGLLFDHFDRYSDLWEPLQQCYSDIPYDQYRVPPLVIQSFNADGLSDFHDTWVNSDYNDVVAEPKYVLLTDDEDCWEDEFWFDISHSYKSFLSGLGCEKVCLLDGDKGGYFASKAKENDLVVHSYTERPEQEYLEYGATSLEETQHLICTMDASGIFSESISTAVLAASLPCPTDDGNGEANQVDDQSASNCSESHSSFYVGFVSFIIGALGAALFTFWWLERRRRISAIGAVQPKSNYHDTQGPSSSSMPTSPPPPPPESHPDLYMDAMNDLDLELKEEKEGREVI